MTVPSKFRDGRRLGNALKVNADRLNYHAKGELRRGRLEEARELYEKAIEMDPRDGRAYFGLSRIAQRRRDFAYARKCLKAGITNSFTKQESPDGAVIGDSGANPFLLQALGCLEERVGNLAEAEALYVEAAKSRPSHAAAWVSLAQLRTRKFRQGANAGRVCYQTAERELQRAGLAAVVICVHCMGCDGIQEGEMTFVLRGGCSRRLWNAIQNARQRGYSWV